jgi:hypothetical protein
LSYLDKIAAQVRAELPSSELPGAEGDALFRLYAVLVLVKGEQTEAADVHDVWVAWKSERDPADPDIRPFAELDRPTRAADEPFAAAIRGVATRMSRTRHS